jgi:hypothetical protein
VTELTLTAPIEAVHINEAGDALGRMVDFGAGETIVIEKQGSPLLFGWENPWMDYYRSRGWSVKTETVFRYGRPEWERGPARYVTFNLNLIETGAPQ